MAMHYRLELEIGVSRARVCELFGDPENLGAWQPGFLGIEPIESEGKKKFRLRYSHRKREVEMIETIEADDLPDEYTATYEAPGMEMRVRNRFEELGAEKTRWISENEGRVSGLLMRVISLVMPGCFKKESAKFMENFKAFAEEGKDLRNEQ